MLGDPAREDVRLQPERDGRVRCSARLCENSSTTRLAEKATLTFAFWRIFIFGEGDSNPFFVLQNAARGVFTQPRAWLAPQPLAKRSND
jgi:hypothetical protein